MSVTNQVHGSSSFCPHLSGLPTTEATGRDGRQMAESQLLSMPVAFWTRVSVQGVMGRVTTESSPLGLPPYRMWPGGNGNEEWPERVRGSHASAARKR